MRLQFIVGLGGVCVLESKGARLLGKLFEYGMTVVAVLLLLQWHFEIYKDISLFGDMLISWVIWLFFVIQTLILLSVVEDKGRYLRENWFNAVVIICGIPVIFNWALLQSVYQFIRPFLALVLFAPWLGLLKRSLTDNKLITTLVSAFFVVILAGVLISGMDPAITSPWQGIWWAWVTMSTVGYGDYTPISIAGRLVGAVVILVGLCFFAILTANFSSMFLKREVSKARSREMKDIHRVIHRIEEIEARDEEILRLLKALHARLDAIEARDAGLGG
jgi:voltage-gated potassium channel